MGVGQGAMRVQPPFFGYRVLCCAGKASGEWEARQVAPLASGGQSEEAGWGGTRGVQGGLGLGDLAGDQQMQMNIYAPAPARPCL